MRGAILVPNLAYLLALHFRNTPATM